MPARSIPSVRSLAQAVAAGLGRIAAALWANDTRAAAPQRMARLAEMFPNATQGTLGVMSRWAHQAVLAGRFENVTGQAAAVEVPAGSPQQDTLYVYHVLVTGGPAGERETAGVIISSSTPLTKRQIGERIRGMPDIPGALINYPQLASIIANTSPNALRYEILAAWEE